jgi:hypothetical protein
VQTCLFFPYLIEKEDGKFRLPYLALLVAWYLIEELRGRRCELRGHQLDVGLCWSW